MLDTNKPLYKSRTLWSIAIAMAMILAEPIGAYIDKAKKQGLTWTEAGALISLVCGAFFRATATQTLIGSGSSPRTSTGSSSEPNPPDPEPPFEDQQ